MKATTYHRYGSPEVLELQDLEKPVVQEDEVLVRVCAASVNPMDWHFMRGTPYLVRLMTGLRRPKSGRLGTDVAGVVEAVGPRVVGLKAGDEVFGTCRGAFAEYACARERSLVAKPAQVTFEQAAATPVAALTALQGLRDKGRLRPGQRVLVNGAGGGVGTFAVQLAKTLGAEVTGVCSTGKVDLVRSIGADHVLDYTREDFTRLDKGYDLIFDTAGNHSIAATRRALGARGVLVLVGGTSGGQWLEPLLTPLQALVMSLFVGQTLAPFLAAINQGDLLRIGGLLAGGQITPVIDRRYSLGEVPEAIRYLELGHAGGKVVISVP